MTPGHAEEAPAEIIDNVVPTRGYRLAPVVGLGGSAGAIGALQAFFTNMPADTGQAFVVVLHLAPEHESSLPAILQQCTTMPVLQVHDRQRVGRDRTGGRGPSGRHWNAPSGGGRQRHGRVGT